MLLKYKAKEADGGKSVKHIIEREFSLSSRTLSKLKKNGGIKVNGENVTVRFALSGNDILALSLDDVPSETIEKVDIPLDVLYEDDDMLIINKPLGMPTHPSQGHHGAPRPVIWPTPSSSTAPPPPSPQVRSSPIARAVPTGVTPTPTSPGAIP